MKSIFFLCLIKLIISENIKKIFDLTNESFDKLVLPENEIISKKWLIVFYGENCPSCDKTIKLLNQEILREFEKNPKINFGSVNCDSPDNFWLNVRFNITRIPYVILIIDNKMFEYNYYFEKFHIIDFINEEKDEKDSLLIPEPISYYDKVKFSSKYSMNKINKKIPDIVKDKYGVDIIWNSIFTLIFIIFCFTFLIVLLIIVKKILCLFPKLFKKNQKNTDNDNNLNNDVSSGLSDEEIDNLDSTEYIQEKDDTNRGKNFLKNYIRNREEENNDNTSGISDISQLKNSDINQNSIPMQKEKME